MKGRLAPISGLFQELRRRKVIHVAAVYLGGVIVGMDFVGNAMETYHLPQGLQQAFGVLVVLGFPVAVLTSWWYDWTGEGIRRVESERPPRPVHRLAVASAVALVILSGAVGTLVAVRSPEPSGPLSATGSQPASEADPGLPSGSNTVLGILPVENVGPDSRWSWLGLALASHLEVELDRIPVFTVIHRRALEAYRLAATPLDSLAALLDVDYFVSAQVTGAPAGEVSVLVELVRGSSNEVVSSDLIRVGTPSEEALDTLVLRVQEVLRPALGQEHRLARWRYGTSDTVAVRLRYQAEQRFITARDVAMYDPVAAQREFAAADSILAVAIRREPDWLDPRLARAQVAGQWALSLLGPTRDRPAAAAVFDLGITQANAALADDPESAEALALRGHLRWRKTQLAWTGEAAARAEMIDRAEADLRAALELDPRQVVAAASLSEILYWERRSFAEARSYALQAFRQDAYLDRANEIINRIALSAFEVGDDQDALDWSRRGLRRAPDAPIHHGAILEIMAWGRVDPDPDEAWRHLRAITERWPGPANHYGYAVAGVLARAGLADSARAVLARHLDGLDPRTRRRNLDLEAAVRFRLGDTDRARDLFEAFRQLEPEDARQAASARLLQEFIDAPS